METMNEDILMAFKNRAYCADRAFSDGCNLEEAVQDTLDYEQVRKAYYPFALLATEEMIVAGIEAHFARRTWCSEPTREFKRDIFIVVNRVCEKLRGGL